LEAVTGVQTCALPISLTVVVLEFEAFEGWIGSCKPIIPCTSLHL
jgi:hypothetical protein